MRWNIKPQPEVNEVRYIKIFALLPCKANNLEVRWLEFVMIKQIFVLDYYRRGQWENVCFVDTELEATDERV